LDVANWLGVFSILGLDFVSCSVPAKTDRDLGGEQAESVCRVACPARPRCFNR
jgi:hypothetical protein